MEGYSGNFREKKDFWKKVQKSLKIIFCLLLVSLVGLSGFFGGIQWQKNQPLPIPEPEIMLQGKKLSSDEIILLQVFRIILNDYVDEIDSRELLKSAIRKGMLKNTDPYSLFLEFIDLLRNDLRPYEGIEIVENISYRILERNIGYLKIRELGTGIDIQVKKILEKFNKKGVKGLILDLRGCHGGILSTSINLASFFVSPGTLIVELRSKRGSEKYYAKEEIVFEKPMIILVDEKTTSAAELVAGSLQTAERAKIVGTRTYGKGTAQKIYEFEWQGFILYLTFIRFYFSNGETPEGKGIIPDIIMKSKNIQLEELYKYLE